MAWAAAAARAVGKPANAGARKRRTVQTERARPEPVLVELPAPIQAKLNAQPTCQIRMSVRFSKQHSGEDFCSIEPDLIKRAALSALSKAADTEALQKLLETDPIAYEHVKVRPMPSQYIDRLPQVCSYAIGVACSQGLKSDLLESVMSKGGLKLDLERVTPTLAMPIVNTQPVETQYILDVTTDMFEAVTPEAVSEVLSFKGLTVKWVVGCEAGMEAWVADKGRKPDPGELLKLLPPAKNSFDNRYVALVSGGYQFINEAIKAGMVKVSRGPGVEPLKMRLWRYIPTARRTQAAEEEYFAQNPYARPEPIGKPQEGQNGSKGMEAGEKDGQAADGMVADTDPAATQMAQGGQAIEPNIPNHREVGPADVAMGKDPRPDVPQTAQEGQTNGQALVPVPTAEVAPVANTHVEHRLPAEGSRATSPGRVQETATATNNATQAMEGALAPPGPTNMGLSATKAVEGALVPPGPANTNLVVSALNDPAMAPETVPSQTGRVKVAEVGENTADKSTPSMEAAGATSTQVGGPRSADMNSPPPNPEAANAATGTATNDLTKPTHGLQVTSTPPKGAKGARSRGESSWAQPNSVDALAGDEHESGNDEQEDVDMGDVSDDDAAEADRKRKADVSPGKALSAASPANKQQARKHRKATAAASAGGVGAAAKAGQQAGKGGVQGKNGRR